MNLRKIIREEVDDFDWVRDINPLDIIATSFLNKVAVRRHDPYAYVRQWNYNMPYHVINKKNYGFRDSYERLKNKFFGYLDEGIISDVPLEIIPMIHKRMLTIKDKEYIWEKVVSEILQKMGFDPNIHESKTDDFDWSENTGYEFTKEINTEEANQNFNNEVNGYYAISTPKGKDFPETILAYGPVFYIKQVLSYINDLDDPYWGNMDLYLGKITYSRRDKDNVLSLTKYY